MRAVACLLALALAGCATHAPPEPVIRTVEVRIPYPVACAKKPGPERIYPDTPEALRAAPDLFSRVALLLAGRELRIADAKALRAGYEGCP